MKQLLLFLIALSVLITISSCGDDEDPPTSSPNTTVLQLDGDNQTAPTMPAGFFEFAIRFTSSDLSRYQGESITQISFYLYNDPGFINLTISPDQTSSAPGEIVYEQNVTNPRTNGWNTITLTEPYLVDGSPLWIGVQVDLNSVMQTVGCDAGPARPNGDWLYDDVNDREWRTFRDRTGESVNWNIRATVTTDS